MAAFAFEPIVELATIVATIIANAARRKIRVRLGLVKESK
jgi:hypothetical protein